MKETNEIKNNKIESNFFHYSERHYNSKVDVDHLLRAYIACMLSGGINF